MAVEQAEKNPPRVSEALYRQTLETLGKKGYSFFYINPHSINRLLSDQTTKQLFGEITYCSEETRSDVPPKIIVAIDPNNLIIEERGLVWPTKMRTIQGRIAEREAALKSKLPKKVGDVISIIVSKHASILVQLDFEYQQRTGRVLFDGWFGYIDGNDQTGIEPVYVGRYGSTGGLDVIDRNRDEGSARVFDFPVVVSPLTSSSLVYRQNFTTPHTPSLGWREDGRK